MIVGFLVVRRPSVFYFRLPKSRICTSIRSCDVEYLIEKQRTVAGTWIVASNESFIDPLWKIRSDTHDVRTIFSISGDFP